MSKYPSNLPEQKFHKIFSCFDPMRSGFVSSQELMAAVSVTTLPHGSNIIFIVKAAMKGAALYEAHGKSGKTIMQSNELNLNSLFFTQDVYEICLRSICTTEAAILLVSEYIRRKFANENRRVNKISFADMMQFISQNNEFESLLLSEHQNTINAVNKMLNIQENNEIS